MAKEYKLTCICLFVMTLFLIGILFMYFERSYDVVFDSMGGSQVGIYNVNAGDVIQSVPIPVKEGFVFAGWYIDGTDREYDFSLPIKHHMTLKARWKSIF